MMRVWCALRGLSSLLVAVLVVCGSFVAEPTQAGAAARVVNISNANRVGRVQVTIGKSDSLRVNLPFSEIVVGDPETADVSPLTDRTLYVLGRKLGSTNVTLFDTDKQVMAVIDIEVTYDLESLRQVLNENIPGSRIRVRSINGRVLLEGLVPSAPAAEKAMKLAASFAGPDITNALTVAGNQQVNLEVRFVEVNRLAGKELGINYNLTNNNEGYKQGSGTLGRQDVNIAPILGLTALAGAPPFGAILANVLGNGISPDIVISALEQKKLARRLAEPNLTTVSGEEANFHAGGEFPIPVAQDDNKITVDFKEFGVKLRFLPVVLDDGLISLRISPEVSEIDQAASIRVVENGILIPGLSVRRASTVVELRDGQSFAIAGLLQSVNQRVADQLPWLGDVPVLGALFRSSSFQKRESDLVIIVTPRLVRPVGNREQLATPLDDTLSSNEPELFLLGKLEVSRKELDEKFHGRYGHILDLPKGITGAVIKR